MINIERKGLTYYKELAHVIMEANKSQDLGPGHPGESVV